MTTFRNVPGWTRAASLGPAAGRSLRRRADAIPGATTPVPFHAVTAASLWEAHATPSMKTNLYPRRCPFALGTGLLALGLVPFLAATAPALDLLVNPTAPNGFIGTYVGPSYTIPASGVVYDTEYIGYDGTGTVTHSVGTNTAVDVYLGYNPGGTGHYTLSGTGTLSAGNEVVGFQGSGSFMQTGGTNAIGSFLTVGNTTTGSYTLGGTGALSASGETIGNGGSGSFTQTGGTNTVGGILGLGANSGSSGIYTLTGGTLAADTVAGGHGAATFNFNGGTLQAAGSNTTFVTGLTNANVQAGGAVIDSNGFDVTIAQPLLHDAAPGVTADGGLTKNGAGTLTLNGGNTYAGATTVNAGTLAVGTGTSLGNGGVNVTVANGGAFALSGTGAVSAANENLAGSFVQSGGTNTVGNLLTVGVSYTLSGTGAVSAANENLAGSFVQSGGTNTVGNSLNLGGSYTLGGTGGLSAAQEVLGNGTDSTFVQNGGTNSVGTLQFGGQASGGNQTYALNGGVLETGSVSSLRHGPLGAQIDTFNFNGGTLQASGNNTFFVSGLNTANVQAGGAVIDSNGNTVTIRQPLVHDSALGATADGGLTKLGTGTLTLSGLNTYTGGTTVSGGVLEVALGGTLGTGDVSVQITCVHLTLDTGVLDAINNSARLTLDGGGTPGVADVGYLQLNGNVVTVSSLDLGGTLYTSGIFTSLTSPDYIAGAGEVIVGAVPEPSAWAMLLVGAGLLGGARRWRRGR